ncbi:dna-directed rna polymerase [Holotrichia oblita]|uniref:Dna-directed rna polymerase n=1 Tax=Holotrichia oblita TaxID=644536 RepID=A0ACB9SRK3_HOLOL|nr:dna-directed rna polymerase [Holotrichia oblita]
MASSQRYTSYPGFCSDCGSILPLLRDHGNVTCYTCEKEHSAEVFGDKKIQYTINFNSRETLAKNVERKNQKSNEEDEGPVVDRKCPKCGNDKMSYATLQLRSADEGQTVFYTCTKCSFKETENS